ncbi:hypothetical protein B0H63DRAFT_550289 [Podospora didyma]|uniref:Uncharacterized protein n=1 Tax=Podospora didyma TaxID=330526 RepID=A0AAE0K8N2_9PEZI|nr:hypothetical protein B0H63DRAFT_550289 [Podospora didyma]
MPTLGESTQDNDPPILRFTDVQDLFDVIDYTTRDFLIVTNVSPSHFTEIEREREEQRRKFRFRRYDSNARILIITLPTEVHEALHLGIYMRYHTQLVPNGREESWISKGTTAFRQQGHPGGDGREGDSTGVPKPEREGKDKWPTLWWFRTSNHDVKIVILAKFDRQQHHILLEKSEEEISLPQGAITRGRAAAILQQGGVFAPVKRQSITITRDETTNPVSYNVTRGALVLGFRLRFLRDPGPQEGDFVLGIQDLQRFAKGVWAAAGLNERRACWR